MTEKRFRAAIPLYETSLYLVVTNNVQEYYEKHIGEDKGRCPVAFTAWINGDLCIVVSPRVTLGTLAHEIVHASVEILEHHGLRWGKSNQEPVCYLVSWLMDWVDRRLKKEENKSRAKSDKPMKINFNK